jgi:hypothetical protein
MEADRAKVVRAIRDSIERQRARLASVPGRRGNVEDAARDLSALQVMLGPRWDAQPDQAFVRALSQYARIVRERVLERLLRDLTGGQGPVSAAGVQARFFCRDVPIETSGLHEEVFGVDDRSGQPGSSNGVEHEPG